MNLPLPLRLLLWPLSLMYGAVVGIKAAMYEHGWLKSKRLKGAVISVGNITTGGTGKTPMVIWLAEKFLAEGKRVAILSRGYRGLNGTSDEIQLMKSRLQDRVAFGVDKDRHAAGTRIEAEQPIDVFLLDDGFQHQRLARNANVLVVDGTKDLTKEFLLPAGTLREPLWAMRRGDAVIVTRKEGLSETERYLLPTFIASTRLKGFGLLESPKADISLPEIGPGPYFGFCGIGNPEAFFHDLQNWQIPLRGQVKFRDHHRYSEEDLAKLNEFAKKAGACALVTTEKDAQNLPSRLQSSLPIYVATIEFEVPAEAELLKLLSAKLSNGKGVAA